VIKLNTKENDVKTPQIYLFIYFIDGCGVRKRPSKGKKNLTIYLSSYLRAICLT
jgi:hypothetical protein